MSFNFKESAEQRVNNTGNSFPILTDRVAVKPDDVMKHYPNGVTIIAFGWWKNGDLVPVIFAEDERVFLWAGKILKDIITGWLDAFNYDAEAASSELARNGGVKVKFKSGKTKNGKPITYVEIL